MIKEIKENDLFYSDGHPVGDGIRTCYWISKDRPCWSDDQTGHQKFAICYIEQMKKMDEVCRKT